MIKLDMTENFSYDLLAKQADALSEGQTYLISTLGNISALLFDTMEDISWAGFYLVRQNVLHLGPFQGKAACVEIQISKGVCGTAVSTDKAQIVRNVHEFPGHIACDSETNSEIVLPIHHHGEVAAVLDIDSKSIGRFSEKDGEGLMKLITIIEKIWRPELL